MPTKPSTTHPAPPPTQGGRWSALWSGLREAIRGSRQDFTEGSMGRAIFLLAVPMVLETSMHSIFSVCDTYFVGKLGPAAVASVGLTDSLQAVIFAVALGLMRANEKAPSLREMIQEKGLDYRLRMQLARALGLMGDPQAVQTLLILAGQGEALVNRLLLFDAYAMEWQGVTLPKNPDCPACAKK